jgi:uncharacterized protein (TIGR00725 family)
MKSYIGVIGASEATAAERANARAVGSALAEAGAIVVCGGLGGVMEAVCEGAKLHDGLTIGVLPGSDRATANVHVDVALPSGLGELRNGLIVRFSDAVIAIGGEWGTLSEIAFAMRTGRQVVALGSWERVLGDERSLRRAESPEDAVALALAAASDTVEGAS